MIPSAIRFLAVGTLISFAVAASTAVLAQNAPSFEGTALLVLSDADMPSSAFVDGKIIGSDRDRTGRDDTLTVLSLPIRPQGTPDTKVTIAEVSVSNSVVGPPYTMAASPDGRFVYVLETRGPAPKGVETVTNVFAGLSARSHVTVVDIKNRAAPKVVEKVIVGSHTHTLDLRPDGRMLAINTGEPGRHVVLRHVGKDGRIGTEAATLGIEIDGRPLRRVGRVQWHPSGRFLALTLPLEDQVRFYRVADANGAVTITQWGAAVTVGDFPDEGTFTPDGRYYISTDLHWGDRLPPNYLTPPNGTFTAVRFDIDAGNHKVTGQAPTSISPEGIAISPNGRFVVAANLMRSFMPWNDERLTMGGSLDLLSLDPTTGALNHVANYPVHGILPEGLAFDAFGNYLAVTIFDRFDPRRRRGAVEFWRLIDKEQPRLERTNYGLEVVPGAHTLLLVR